MTRMWYYSLAFALGTISTSMAFGQYGAYPVANYAGGPSGLAPSSYPIQFPGPQQNMGYVSNMPNAAIPTVPSGYNAQIPMVNNWVGPNGVQYQLVAQSQQVPALNDVVPVPTQSDTSIGYDYRSMAAPPNAVPGMQPYPSGMQAGSPQSMQPGCNCSQPMVNQGYNTMLAPNCSSYGGPQMGYAPNYDGCNTGNCGYGCAPGPAPGFGGHGGGHLHNLFGRNANGNRNWFVGAGLLLFNRVDDDRIALTYDTGAPTPDVLSTRDARMGVMAGYEIMAGRYFNCGRNAIVGSYWGLFPDTEMATATTTVNLRSRHPFTGIEMPGGPTVYDWYDGAIAHRVERSSRYHNVEANLLGFGVGGAARSFSAGGHGGFGQGGLGGGMFASAGSCNSGCGSCGGSGCNSCAGTTGPCCLIPPSCGSRLNLTWLAGFRYFRFEDNFQYAASSVDGAFNGGADDLYYDIDVTNNLVGFQGGAIINYCVGKKINLFSVNKVGVYNNYSTYYARIGTNEVVPSVAIVNSLNAYNGQQFLIDTNKNDIALLAETGVGLGIRMSHAISATVSYRAIAASGIATAVTQIPFEMTHLGNVADYNNNSSLILHGLQIGGIYNF